MGGDELEFSVVGGNLINQQVEAVVVNLFAGVARPGGGTGAVDDALGGLISKLIQLGEIRGVAGELTVIHTFGETYGNFSPDRVLVAGLGSKDKFDLDDVRNTAANVGRRLRKLGIRSAASLTHGAGVAGLPAHECAEAIAEGTSLGLYRFDKYMTRAIDDGDVNQAEFENLVIGHREILRPRGSGRPAPRRCRRAGSRGRSRRSRSREPGRPRPWRSSGPAPRRRSTDRDRRELSSAYAPSRG